MRKTLALFLVLTLALSVGGVLAARAMIAPADQVAFYENCVFGDRAAARGVTVEQNCTFGDRLLWTSYVNFTEEDYAVSTDLTLKDSDQVWSIYERSSGEEYMGVYLYTEYYYDMSWEDVSGWDLHLGDRLMEMADSMEPGSEKAETVKLADWEEYYPLSVNIELPQFGFGYSPYLNTSGDENDPEQKSCRAIADFFRIPVLEGDTCTLHVTKDYDGTTYGGVEPAEDRGCFNMYTMSAVTEEAIYFWFDNSAKGQRVDTGLIPGGYGIYILPYGLRTVEEGMEWRDYKPGDQYPDVFTEELRVFYPVAEDVQILSLKLSRDNSQLLLFTQEQNRMIVTVIDTVTGEALQRLTVCNFGEDVYIDEIRSCGDYFVLYVGKSFYVLAENGGQWSLPIATRPCELEQSAEYTPGIWNGRTYAFDGQRLVVSGCTEIRSQDSNAQNAVFVNENAGSFTYRDGCGFYVAVYDKDRLVYYGIYDSSLDESYTADGAQNYFNICPVYNGGVQVTVE